MPVTSLKSLFTRDLNRLKKEISAYQQEATLWKTDKNVSNSAGNLCLHLVGNLNHFIGAMLGSTGYVRQRKLEFSTKNVPVKELLSEIDKTILMIENTLDQLNAKTLHADYPLEVFGEKMSTEYFLLHLSTHLNYHLGQVNYHRRLLDTENTKQADLSKSRNGQSPDSVVVFRKANLADLPILYEFEQGIILAERPFDVTLKPDPINYYDLKKYVQADDVEVIVAEVNGEIVGSGYAKIEHGLDYRTFDEYAYLGFMFVKPAFRGRGIIRGLIEALKDWSRSRGLDELRLEVYDENDPAVRAYEKAGFEKSLVLMRLGV